MRDTELGNRLRAAGLEVSELSGWKVRGSTAFTPRGVVTHHTAGPKSGNVPSLNVCVHGRSGIPGPLCNVLVGRDNTCFVVAAGRANHAGRGSWGALSGNSSVYGVEFENTGYGDGPNAEPWRDDQVELMARIAAALAADQFGADACCFHKEWTSRKVDPHTLGGDDHRRRVARLLAGITSQPPAATPADMTGVEMFLAIEGVGLFAVIDGIPMGFADLGSFGAAMNASPGVPMMRLPRDPGEQMFQEMLKKHAAAIG